MPKAEDGVKKDPSAPEGGSKKEEGSAAPQNWQEVLAAEQERARKAEEREAQWKEAALKNKRLAKEAKENELVSETEDERVERLASEVSKRVVTTVTEDSLLKAKIPDAEQRKVVKLLLDTRIQRTGTSEEALESDIEDAINLANSKKAQMDNKELKRALANDPRGTPAAGSNADRGVERKAHEWTPEQEKVLKEKAKALRIDPDKFLADSWKNRSRTSSIA